MDYTRPETLQLGSASVTIRNAWAVWILSFITLNIYGIFWWYQVNRELQQAGKAYDVRLAASPPISAVLMALWPIALIPAGVGHSRPCRSHASTHRRGASTRRCSTCAAPTCGPTPTSPTRLSSKPAGG